MGIVALYGRPLVKHAWVKYEDRVRRRAVELDHRRLAHRARERTRMGARVTSLAHKCAVRWTPVCHTLVLLTVYLLRGLSENHSHLTL